jgi:hypothetical protein
MINSQEEIENLRRIEQEYKEEPQDEKEEFGRFELNEVEEDEKEVVEEREMETYKSPITSLPNIVIKMENEETLQIEENDEEHQEVRDQFIDDSLYKVLDVMKDLDSEYSLRFEDSNWESHTASLKPLGLNCILTTKHDLSNGKNCLCEDNIALWKSFYSFIKIKEYVYLLGKEIGFEDNIIELFKSHQEIHTQRGLKQMSSVIVSYEDGFQIHSHGEPTLILDYCSCKIIHLTKRLL